MSPDDRIARLFAALDRLPVGPRRALAAVIPVVLLGVLVAAFVLGARGQHHDGASTAVRKVPAATAATAPAATTVPSAPLTEAPSEESPPRSRDLPAARRVAQRFARAWLAHAVGRAPASAVRDALPPLRRRLDVVVPRPSKDQPLPTARIGAVERQRASDPRLLLADVRVKGAERAGVTRATFLLAWSVGQWRVVDLRVEQGG